MYKQSIYFELRGPNGPFFWELARTVLQKKKASSRSHQPFSYEPPMAIFPKDTGGKDALQEPRDPGQSLRKVPSFHHRPPLRLQRRRR